MHESPNKNNIGTEVLHSDKYNRWVKWSYHEQSTAIDQSESRIVTNRFIMLFFMYNRHNYFYSVFDQINGALVSIRNFFQKHFLKRLPIPNIW